MQLADHGRHAARPIVVLAEVFTGRLQVHQQRHVVAVTSPSRRACSSTPMCRAIALMWIGALVEPPIAEFTRIALMNAVARQDVGRLAVGAHHLDDPPAGPPGAFLAIAIRRRDRRASRAATCPSASASEFIVVAVPIVLQ